MVSGKCLDDAFYFFPSYFCCLKTTTTNLSGKQGLAHIPLFLYVCLPPTDVCAGWEHALCVTGFCPWGENSLLQKICRVPLQKWLCHTEPTYGFWLQKPLDATWWCSAIVTGAYDGWGRMWVVEEVV